MQGVLIGLAGTLAGAALGCCWSRNLERIVHGWSGCTGTQFLDAKVYFMSDLPAHVEAGDVLRICGVAFAAVRAGDAVSGLARGAMLPAEALRHD